jgi:hypothetical protein
LTGKKKEMVNRKERSAAEPKPKKEKTKNVHHKDAEYRVQNIS